MKLRRLAAVLNTLILRGAGSGVAVLFTVLVSRFADTADAARFFLLFNISVIAAVCYRWGLDEVIIRRVASASASEISALKIQLVGLSHRRVLVWMGGTMIIALIFSQTKISSLLPGFAVTEIFSLIVASALVALSACAARVRQGEGHTNLATFLLNIAIPLSLLLGLLLLKAGGWHLNADSLFFLYASGALFVYLITVFATYGNPISNVFYRTKGKCSVAINSDSRAANKLGGVVFAQQALLWVALVVVPLAYGAQLYKGFVVAQKIATLISLVMLAVNFTLSSRFAILHAEGDWYRLRKIIKISLVAIAGASILASVMVVAFREQIFEFARVEARMDGTLLVLLLSQIFFSSASLFSVVLSMCRDDDFLLLSQGMVSFFGVLLFVCLSFFCEIEVACLAFVLSYFSLSLVLGMRVRHITAS
ncbi:O-antigen/teichoic acid export membrane protein [Variovorax paradoxus]|uniref:O-antigen/teichoic acid export membrane protein n=1 Tax=Variovorax paradoxus TaxID=34073 RepID=A0AAW8EPW5_VARPD|nr:hypothetical protein [Variovorax paradoxus]MDP9975035.1 O-antigen/teichoic acid export membrane protein [Variovorax paradoxus]